MTRIGRSSKRQPKKTLGTSVRVCGDCSACCVTHGVPAMNKDAGAACHRMRPTGGCMVYEIRPRACRTYKCAWLMGLLQLEDRDRPDRIGLVLDLRDNEILGPTVQLYELWTDARVSPFAQEHTTRWVDQGLVVYEMTNPRRIKAAHDHPKRQMILDAMDRFRGDVG